MKCWFIDVGLFWISQAFREHCRYQSWFKVSGSDSLFILFVFWNTMLTEKYFKLLAACMVRLMLHWLFTDKKVTWRILLLSITCQQSPYKTFNQFINSWLRFPWYHPDVQHLHGYKSIALTSWQASIIINQELSPDTYLPPAVEISRWIRQICQHTNEKCTLILSVLI